ncbi:GNAT family N-acetyltransferase [Paucibacter sp. AS339]|uniref:GNAT family N-acetyltransferase n=1 Tax=Paucibacter hankyongi TaxID=3133434 RepID=UPI0030AFD029
MSTPLQIRDAVEADLPALLQLFQTSGLDTAGHGDLVAVREAWWQLSHWPGARVRVAESGGRIIGSLTLFILPMLSHQATPCAVVESVGVDAALQGQGAGRALMEDAMRLAAQAGCYKLALSSNLRRSDAHAFYQHLGFDQHGLSFKVALPEAAS